MVVAPLVAEAVVGVQTHIPPHSLQQRVGQCLPPALIRTQLAQDQKRHS